MTLITNNPSDNLVVFENGETHESILEGFTLQGGWMAIWCKDSGPTIRKNIIKDQNIYNWATISLGGQGIGTYGSSPIFIENCTIVGGINGAISSFSIDTVTVINTIIAFNDYGIHVQDPVTCPIRLGYNDVFGNGVNYYNVSNYGPGTISLDPLFNPDYSLQPGSPCIDAGDPDSPLDPDGTIADMGAVYFPQGLLASFDIAVVYGENNQPVDVPVTAHGLADQDVAGAEFHISFDNTCLQYDTVTSDYFADMLANVVNDEIHILWEDYANPVFLPESTAAFVLHFTVLGQLGDTCSIGWLGNNEVVDSLGNVITGIAYTEGSVRVIEFHSISGRVIYYDMTTPLENIDMQLTGDWTATEATDQNGFYEFENLFPGDFIICPEREDDDPGVTVSDVVKIRRHLVLLEPFDTPYKYVAADVNESDYVSVADIIKIRRYLAGLEPLPSGNWSFVDSSFAITDENWMDAPDCIEFSIWNLDLTDSSFIGVRMGDVDVTLGFNSSILLVMDNVLLDLIDAQGSPGDTVVMPLQVQGFINVAGIELHLEFPEDNVEFVELNSNIISDYTLNCIDGEIHLVWEDIDNALTLPSNTELLSLSFEILPGTIDNVPVTFTSAYVVDVFGTDFNVFSSDALIILIPVLIEDFPLLPENFLVYQNYPNPFNARTVIKFELPTSSQVKIEIFDLLGRKIETLLNARFDAGYHDATWNAENYPSGVYFYMMQAENYSNACKMILLK
ncbi:MAG: T9SS type A sorting domain-containing protein [Candidatus Zixiibacteriota bacterium]|nr:MAG: T9SS type A sorting domain-containing protein [candidate division Zixibacteria bacterium]